MRCPHFQLRSEPLSQEETYGYLAVRHCMMTARMRDLLTPVPEASALVRRLSIQLDAVREYTVVGPDLDAVTQPNCHVARCDGSCTPSYKSNLLHFGIVDPHEDTVTCSDEASDIEKPAPSTTMSVPPCTRA